ncbi:phosphate:Na+ symporter [Evansella caseinilytica]|uniref:Phosphate:Na+ symporter n=1 Tax=Evansella caseinilytica TaxID=1503961 RepID=A0A1H3KHM7_9BACI|nr:Na/Pi symporter [Evansella caseinilytica]SDY51616.1 phosphate:Na+ symporter [Evansella caseinilytica]
MNDIFSLFIIYISLFLFGMTVMRQGLIQLQGRKLSVILQKAVDHPGKGMLLGAVVTALLQSSSAVMVITVGLVASKVISFRHSIGIILGANIGTVITLEILAFDLSWLIFPLLLLGVPLIMTKSQLLFCTGCFLFGFSSIIVAMHGFEALAYPLSSVPAVYDWLLTANSHEVVSITIGILLSAVIQSSSAVTAIAMSFMNETLLTLPGGIGIMLGANLGTCATAWLSSLGGSKESKLTAYAHIWLNLFGIFLFFPFIQLFAAIVGNLGSSPAQQLAHATLIYNVICSLIVFPFLEPFSKFLQWIHRTPLTEYPLK